MANTTPKKPALPKGAKKTNPARLQHAKSTIQFSATFRPKTTGSWTLLTLPKSASAKLPSQDMAMVEGTINGFPFRAALEAPRSRPSNGSANHALRLSKALQDGAGADDGESVAVEITRVGDEPECRVPLDLRKALDAAPAAQALWASWADITPMARRDWILWITSAKQEETRARRIENACDMLASGKRRPCCMPGINWRTKDCDITPDDTWLPLPSSKGRASARSTK